MHYKAASRAERHERRRRWHEETRRAVRGGPRRSDPRPRSHELERQQARMEAVLAG